MAKLRWPTGPVCPRCGCVEYSYLTTRRLWKCKACKKQFSVKVGTIFEDSALGLDKWLPAIWLIANAKNGISSHELARALGSRRSPRGSCCTASASPCRPAPSTSSTARSKPTRRSSAARPATCTRTSQAQDHRHGRQGQDRSSWASPARRRSPRERRARHDRRRTLQGQVSEHVEPGATIYTDALRRLRAASTASTTPRRPSTTPSGTSTGNVHTNGLENFWSLLKRALHGTYVSVEPFHLFRYLDERLFGFNRCDDTDYGRFEAVLRAAAGRRLTYEQVTGRA